MDSDLSAAALSSGGEFLLELCGLVMGIYCLIRAAQAADRKDLSEFVFAGLIGIGVIWFVYAYGNALRSIVDYQLHK